MKNESNSITPPNMGWMYNKNGTFVIDTSFTLSIAPNLPQKCKVITITSTSGAEARYPEYLGIFTRTDKYVLGRPVFVNRNGKFLKMYHGDGNWCIGDSFLNPNGKVCSPSSSICPSSKCASSNNRPDVDMQSWFYVSGAGIKKEDTTIFVKCDLHSDI